MSRSAELSPPAEPPGRSVVRPTALFTPERATATLPLVRRIVADVVPLALDLADRRARLAWVRRTPGAKQHHAGPHAEELEDVERHLARDSDRLSGYVAEIRRLGAVLRDAAAGLVEFPGPRISPDGESRDGYYSWRPGEDAVTHWRPAAADPTDRAPVRSLVVPVVATADRPAVDHAA